MTTRKEHYYNKPSVCFFKKMVKGHVMMCYLYLTYSFEVFLQSHYFFCCVWNIADLFCHFIIATTNTAIKRTLNTDIYIYTSSLVKWFVESMDDIKPSLTLDLVLCFHPPRIWWASLWVFEHVHTGPGSGSDSPGRTCWGAQWSAAGLSHPSSPGNCWFSDREEKVTHHFW